MSANRAVELEQLRREEVAAAHRIRAEQAGAGYQQCRTCVQPAQVHLEIYGKPIHPPLTKGVYCTQHGRLVASEASLRGFDVHMRGL